MINVFIPAYGPQLRKMLSASTLLDSMMSGVTQLRFGHTFVAGADVDEPVELELELELAAAQVGPDIVSPINVTGPVPPNTMARPFKVTPLPKATSDPATMVPTNEEPLTVAWV